MFQSPQWGSNSKVKEFFFLSEEDSFSPLNGEVILKGAAVLHCGKEVQFQSPQWGSNSKGNDEKYNRCLCVGFSPLNGEVILKN